MILKTFVFDFPIVSDKWMILCALNNPESPYQGQKIWCSLSSIVPDEMTVWLGKVKMSEENLCFQEYTDANTHPRFF